MIVAVLLFMVWGDDGPMWKNLLMLVAVISVIAAVIGAGAWVSTYGN